jgi:hypothetical protein
MPDGKLYEPDLLDKKHPDTELCFTTCLDRATKRP